MEGMRAVLLLVLGLVASAVQAAGLEELKRQFPKHVASAPIDKAHPEVRQCFEFYQSRVAGLTEDNLAREVVNLSRQIDRDIFRYQRLADDADNPLGSAGRHAARQNVNWLQTRLTPYVRRLASATQRR